jgi:hypothetical protein
MRWPTTFEQPTLAPVIGLKVLKPFRALKVQQAHKVLQALKELREAQALKA